MRRLDSLRYIGNLPRIGAPHCALAHLAAQSATMSSVNHALQNNLAARLRARIRRDGPISFHDWMQAALYDERDGYYCRPELIRQGRAGDYRTAPETSPLLAATFAQYFVKSYFDLGEPPQLIIVEAGGGSGQFARGILTALHSSAPQVFAATRYLIDEVSPDARAKARAHLSEFGDQVEFCRLDEIDAPFAAAIIFSNELIDAFPVYRLIGRNQILKQLTVDLTEEGDFVWVEGDLNHEITEACALMRLSLAEGQIYELNLAAADFVSHAAGLLNRGLLITVDYGASRDELLSAPNRFNGTVRAFRRHQFADDPLANPGAQDLTTTVDWTAMQEAGARCGFENLRLERLDKFLLNEGLLEALSSLADQMIHPADVINLQIGAREMIRPDGLAASFQVLIQRKG
jgi:SAM-dependent MidA family methyltransferase